MTSQYRPRSPLTLADTALYVAAVGLHDILDIRELNVLFGLGAVTADVIENLTEWRFVVHLFQLFIFCTSAKHGLAIACRLSVCLSVTFT